MIYNTLANIALVIGSVTAVSTRRETPDILFENFDSTFRFANGLTMGKSFVGVRQPNYYYTFNCASVSDGTLIALIDEGGDYSCATQVGYGLDCIRFDSEKECRSALPALDCYDCQIAWQLLTLEAGTHVPEQGPVCYEVETDNPSENYSGKILMAWYDSSAGKTVCKGEDSCIVFETKDDCLTDSLSTNYDSESYPCAASDQAKKMHWCNEVPQLYQE